MNNYYDIKNEITISEIQQLFKCGNRDPMTYRLFLQLNGNNICDEEKQYYESLITLFASEEERLYMKSIDIMKQNTKRGQYAENFVVYYNNNNESNMQTETH